MAGTGRLELARLNPGGLEARGGPGVQAVGCSSSVGSAASTGGRAVCKEHSTDSKRRSGDETRGLERKF